VLIGPRTAEQAKLRLGCARDDRAEDRMVVKGRSLETGFPAAAELTVSEVRAALAEPLRLVVDAIVASLEHTPPDLASDIAETGVVLAGGSARLDGLDHAISDATGLPVVVPEDPELAVVSGTLPGLGRPTLRAAG